MVKTHLMVRCHAKNRRGEQCQHYTSPGLRVCHMHGGKSPVALAKAEDRMRELVQPAITGLGRLIELNDLGAMKYVLDFAGYKPAVQLQSDSEVTIRLVREDPAPLVLEQRNGRTHE